MTAFEPVADIQGMGHPSGTVEQLKKLVRHRLTERSVNPDRPAFEEIRISPNRRDVRHWYAASIALGIPWWVFLPGHLRLVAGGYLLAWIAAVFVTPHVDLRRRLLGTAMTLGLTLGLWLLVLIFVGHFFGDSESQGQP